LFAVPFGPLLAWKRGDLPGAAQRLMAAFGGAIVAMAVAVAMTGLRGILAPFAIGLSVFIMLGAVTDIAERVAVARQPLRASLRRAAGLPRSAFGTALAHFGLGLSLLGVVCETNFASERIAAVNPSQNLSIAGYELTFEGATPRDGPNYRELVARFTVRRDGDVVATMEPSKRNFASRGIATTEAALLTRGLSQLYLSLGDTNPDGAVAVRAYYKPLVLLIWLGAVVMFAGGALSLSDRRLRIGAPRPASRSKLQAAE
jgi:cytochrome c-type biogenesis protein CcmF